MAELSQIRNEAMLPSGMGIAITGAIDLLAIFSSDGSNLRKDKSPDESSRRVRYLEGMITRC